MNNRIYKKGLAIVLIIALLIIGFLGIKLVSKEEKYAFEGFENSSSKTANENNSVFIDIDGAVNNPGVYELVNGSRVNDAIIAAGGLREGASTKNINKAKELKDGEKIYILNSDEINEEIAENNKLVNLNAASKEMLMTLPGIGEVYAKRIIEYRDKQLFNSIEDIKNISGIGEKTFEKIKDLITTN